MKKKLLAIATAALLALTPVSSSAATIYKVKAGDSLWKIAVKYMVGLSEIIGCNKKSISNPSVIYPGQNITIPETEQSVSDYESEVIRLVNAERSKYGLAALQSDWELSRVARYKSQDMKDNHYFSHTSPVYGSPFDMMKSFGLSYRSAGENIAMGQRTPKAVMDAWMNSPGHRANILNSSFKKIGVGYVANGNYWTQMFIG